MNLEFNRNEDVIKRALSEMKQRFAQVSLGGGKKAIAKQKEKNKLTARQRIDYLLEAEQADLGIVVNRDTQVIEYCRLQRAKAPVRPEVDGLAPGIGHIDALHPEIGNTHVQIAWNAEH